MKYDQNPFLLLLASIFNKDILDDKINKDKKRIIEILLSNFLKLLNNKEKKSISFLVKQMTLNMCNPSISSYFENKPAYQ